MNNHECSAAKTKLNKKISLLFLFLLVFCFSNSFAKNWYVSPNGINSQSGQNGQSSEKPLRSIDYGFNQAAQPGDTVFVMNGTYHNNGFGNGSLSNGTVVYLNNSGTADNPIVLTNLPGHSPVIEFDGAGGITANQIEYVEISGFTIVGQAKNMNTDEAMSQRLTLPKPNYYSGRGIAIWGPANHISIKNNSISYAPGSGIRVNKGDYINISFNRIFNNCWYTSSAESALVIAEAQSIDNNDTIKMIIKNNKVWGNQNKIPFYTTNPPDIGVTNYGTAAQDFIIDGSGVYMTRNKDYETGWFYIANNVSFNNGINGVVVHRTDRAIVVNNTSYMNGATPLASGRQNSSGITINNAVDVKIFNNISYARFPEDFALGKYGDLSNIELDANIIFNGNTPFDDGYVYADPLFVFADTIENLADFSLSENSPAVNQGVLNQWVPEFDFAGKPRVGIPDIGAIEFIEPTFLTGSEEKKVRFLIYPNPATDWVQIDIGHVNKKGELFIWDIHGSEVIAKELPAYQKTHYLDLYDWLEGVYVVQYVSGNYSTTKKLVIN
jgi:hypothetical protein